MIMAHQKHSLFTMLFPRRYNYHNKEWKVNITVTVDYVSIVKVLIV